MPAERPGFRRKHERPIDRFAVANPVQQFALFRCAVFIKLWSHDHSEIYILWLDFLCQKTAINQQFAWDVLFLQHYNDLQKAIHDDPASRRKRELSDADFPNFFDSSDVLAGFKQRWAVRNSVRHKVCGGNGLAPRTLPC